MPAPTDAKPLIMCTRSIRAWQQNAKTQTRRLVRPQPINPRWYLRQQEYDGRWAWWTHLQDGRDCWAAKVRQPHADDALLWIREALIRGPSAEVLYAADSVLAGTKGLTSIWHWQHSKLPSMFVPRWSCRYYAKVLTV